MTSKIWITKDGRQIPIIEMEDDHLLNTVGMLARQAFYVHSAQLFRMYCGMDACGDGAQMCLQREINQFENLSSAKILSQNGHELLPDLMLEAGRRGLALSQKLEESRKTADECFTYKVLVAMK